jgi:prophage regulatory protein
LAAAANPSDGITEGVDVLLNWRMSMTNVRKLVSKKELKSIYGIPYSFAHIARLEAAGLFPRRVRLGACRVAWYADEIEEWIASRPRVFLRAA